MQFVSIKEWEIISVVDVHSNAICHKKKFHFKRKVHMR